MSQWALRKNIADAAGILREDVFIVNKETLGSDDVLEEKCLSDSG